MTDHTACQTHRRPQTTPHDVFPPQTCAQISNGGKERISCQVCGTLAVRCWKTRRSKHDDQKPTNTLRKLITPGFLLFLTSQRPSKMCLAEQCCTVSRKPLRILQLTSPSGTPAPRSTECTMILPTPKSVPTAEWIRVVLWPRISFSFFFFSFSFFFLFFFLSLSVSLSLCLSLSLSLSLLFNDMLQHHGVRGSRSFLH